MRSLRWLATGCILAAVSGCADVTPDVANNAPQSHEEDAGKIQRQGNALGGDIVLFGNGSSPSRPAAPAGGGELAVNSFLWRASLDAISFMPLASADPFGGVIITDWYAPPATPSERFKVTLYVLDRKLRADGVKASLFRQVKTDQGGWVDAPVDPKSGADLENAVLTRARQMRLETAAVEK